MSNQFDISKLPPEQQAMFLAAMQGAAAAAPAAAQPMPPAVPATPPAAPAWTPPAVPATPPAAPAWGLPAGAAGPPSLDSREVLDYGMGPSFVPREIEFRAVFELNQLQLRNGAKGSAFQALVTVIESNNPALQPGVQRAFHFKFWPGAPPASPEGQKTLVFMGQLGELVCSVYGRDPSDKSPFSRDQAKAALIAESETKPNLGYRFICDQTIRQTPKGPRTNPRFTPVPR